MKFLPLGAATHLSYTIDFIVPGQYSLPEETEYWHSRHAKITSNQVKFRKAEDVAQELARQILLVRTDDLRMETARLQRAINSLKTRANFRRRRAHH